MLLTQVQGVIAEYEKAKIAERYRRGKLFRARAGEIVTWKASYGYRRIPRSAATGQAHHEIYEPEAAVVRRIFTDRAAGITVREICRRLNADAIPSPTGKPTWGHSTLCRLLRNEAYIGRVYYNRTESVPDRRPTRRNRQVPRDRDEWIPIDCPRIISDELFQAAGRVATDNTKWSPRRAEPGPVAAQRPCQMRCLRCRHQLPQDARPQRHLAPLLLLPQPRPAARRRRIPPLPRTQHPRRRPGRVRVRPHPRRDHPPRPAAGRRTSRHPDTPRSPTTNFSPPNWPDWTARSTPPTPNGAASSTSTRAGSSNSPKCSAAPPRSPARRKELQHKRTSLADERTALARDNQLRRRVHDFAARIHAVIDTLDDTQKQQLLRLLIEDVRVTGWHVQIRLRIALDPPPPDPTGPTNPKGKPSPHPRPVSSQDGLRSVGGDDFGVVDEAVDHGGGDDVVAEHFAPAAERLVGGDDQAGPFVARGHQLEEQVGGFGLERDVADFVDDDERVAAEPGQFGLETAGVVGFGESGDPFGGGGEQDTVPGLAGPDGQADREVCFAGARSEGDRLQQLRAVLPCDVRVIAETHPLFGRLLAARSFKRWNGVLLLVVDLPDGSPGTIRADATDVFGVGGPQGAVSVLDARGLRELYSLVQRLCASRVAGIADKAQVGSPRP